MKARRSREQTAAIAASRSAILDMEIDCSLLADGDPAADNYACMYAVSKALIASVAAAGKTSSWARKLAAVEALAAVCEHGLRSGGRWQREDMAVVLPGMAAAPVLRVHVSNAVFARLLPGCLDDARGLLPAVMGAAA